VLTPAQLEDLAQVHAIADRFKADIVIIGAAAFLCFMDIATYTFPRAKAAATTALRLDPHSAAAHATLAMLKLAHDRDPDGAEQSCRRSIELAPSVVSGHFAYIVTFC
jgi:hypothetical protein